MKNIIYLIGITVIGFLACGKTSVNEIAFECSDNQAICDLTEANNEFGIDVFKALHREHLKENVFISPFSISTALSMALNGANGDTKSEMISTLKYNGWDLDSLNSAYKAYFNVITNLDDKVKIRTANSLWYRKGFAVKPEFIKVNKESFNSEVLAGDFSNPEIKDEINTWVENKTEGKIKDILDSVDPLDVMFLINAIYFKGNWKYNFETKNTFDGKFKLENGSRVDVKMMVRRDVKFPFYRNSKLRMIEVPYGDSIYSMIFIAPNINYSLNDIIEDLDLSSWNEYIERLSTLGVTVQIPKFKTKFKENLKDILIDLKMVSAFIPGKADFTGINVARSIYIDKVIHQSFVEVDEKGTEAAAATVVDIKDTAAGNFFSLNQPFIYIIRDNATNSILFIGKMMDPR